MGRGTKIFYITSGNPTSYTLAQGAPDPTAVNTQPKDIIISRENGKTWQKNEDNYTWAEKSIGRYKDTTDEIRLSSDNIINLRTPIRGAHIEDFNKWLKAFQISLVNRFGDQYFNTHYVTEAKFSWITAAGKFELARSGENLVLSLNSTVNNFIIGSASSSYLEVGASGIFAYIQTEWRIGGATIFLVTPTAVIANKQIISHQQIISDLPAGTAPFVITSTTNVSNLNVDMLDDWHKSDFLWIIPVPNYTGEPLVLTPYIIRKRNAAKEYANPFTLGKVLELTFGATTSKVLTVDSANLEFCTCDCTCTCTCTCTCKGTTFN